MNVRIELRRKLAGLSGDQERSRRLRKDTFLKEQQSLKNVRAERVVFAEVKGGSFALPMSERGGKLLWRRR